MLLKPRKRAPVIANVPISCPYCSKRISKPKIAQAHSASGVAGGQCSCGAFYVLDDKGKPVGQALLDVTTWACDGDGERARTMEIGVHFDIRAVPLGSRSRRRGEPMSLPIAGGGGTSKPDPKVWFLLLKEK